MASLRCGVNLVVSSSILNPSFITASLKSRMDFFNANRASSSVCRAFSSSTSAIISPFLTRSPFFTFTFLTTSATSKLRTAFRLASAFPLLTNSKLNRSSWATCTFTIVFSSCCSILAYCSSSFSFSCFSFPLHANRRRVSGSINL